MQVIAKSITQMGYEPQRSRPFLVLTKIPTKVRAFSAGFGRRPACLSPSRATLPCLRNHAVWRAVTQYDQTPPAKPRLPPVSSLSSVIPGPLSLGSTRCCWWR